MRSGNIRRGLIHTNGGRSANASLDGQEGHASHGTQVCYLVECGMVCLEKRVDDARKERWVPGSAHPSFNELVEASAFILLRMLHYKQRKLEKAHAPALALVLDAHAWNWMHRLELLTKAVHLRA